MGTVAMGNREQAMNGQEKFLPLVPLRPLLPLLPCWDLSYIGSDQCKLQEHKNL